MIAAASGPMESGWLRILRRRARTARWLFAGPAEWRLAARVLAQAAVVSTLKRVLPLSKLSRVVRRAGPLRRASAESDARALAWVRRIYGTGDGRCLDRACVLASVLAESHADVQVVVGMRKAGASVSGHAWVVVDGSPVGEDDAWLGQFEPMVVFAARVPLDHRSGPA